MSVATTIAQIDNVSLQYAPQVLAGVTAIEAAAATLPGQTKKDIVINSILAGARIGEGVPIPEVQGIAALVDLFVSILRASGIFKSKAAPPAPSVVTLAGAPGSLVVGNAGAAA